MQHLNPQIIKQQGKPIFALLPYDEYLAIKEHFESEKDSALIQKALEKNVGKKRLSLDAIKKKHNITVD
jgi:hypothetical protein